ncbi:hypothetical protein [Stenotrophomonas chelatiphaga]|uniref:hypothetical protein n=1 Tax=Stenotrophomonas chelatiphaga TaxID=517011 RepID=UPI00289F8450|nr:hypothetical protein [Stenotrophomonas chelatiphaga]
MSCPELHDEHRTFRLARDPKRLQEGITVLHECPCATREASMQKRMRAVWAMISPALLILSQTASAEIKTLSRANCIGFINESVTYDRPSFVRFLGTSASTHIPQGNIRPKHVLGAANNGFLSARFYAGDGSDSERMLVRGYHTWVTAGRVWTSNTAAVDCNLVEW